MTANLQNFTNSPKFKKNSTNIVQDTLKLISKNITIALKVIINAIITIFKMMIDK